MSGEARQTARGDALGAASAEAGASCALSTGGAAAVSASAPLQPGWEPSRRNPKIMPTDDGRDALPVGGESAGG